jgi:hypothetical protein
MAAMIGIEIRKSLTGRTIYLGKLYAFIPDREYRKSKSQIIIYWVDKPIYRFALPF